MKNESYVPRIEELLKNRIGSYRIGGIKTDLCELDGIAYVIEEGKTYRLGEV